MRFPRNAKIFRGQLDVVPLVGVLFLLLIFILLSSLVYTPGIPFRIDEEVSVSGTERRVLFISGKGEIVYNGQTNSISNLEFLRSEFSKLPPQSILVLSAAPGAPRQVIVEVRNQVKGLPIILETSSVPIELPVADSVIGTPNPTVTVAVNLGGQFFFENRVISPLELQKKLAGVVAKTPQPLTLLVIADESVEHKVLVQLAEIAKEARISEMLQVTRPPGRK
ncbi:MAG: ExbD/TolR family protein [Limisphaerales bacterium]